MPDENIFEGGQSTVSDPAPATPETSTTPNYDDLLATVKDAEGKQKYNSVEDGLKALGHSQEYIKQLKAEKEAAERAKIEAEAKIKSQEEIAAMFSTTEQDTVSDPQPATQTEPSLTLEQVDAYLAQKEQIAVQETNKARVNEAVQEAYGADAKTKYLEALAANGLTSEVAHEMAKKTPEALLKLLKVEKPSSPSGDTPPSINPQQFNEPAPDAPKSVMKMSSNKDLVEEWRASNKRLEERLNNQS